MGVGEAGGVGVGGSTGVTTGSVALVVVTGTTLHTSANSAQKSAVPPLAAVAMSSAKSVAAAPALASAL